MNIQTLFASVLLGGMSSAMPICAQSGMAQQTIVKSQQTTTTFQNPMAWSDIPDPDVIRVGDNFYMVSTTMHLMPGAPIMKSKDLVNWEIVNYIFPKLTDSPKYEMKNGTVYGRGQWATSLKYHHGKFYALFAPNDNPGGETYICTADDIEGEWTVHSRLPHFHDASLFFDDDDKAYVVYATGEMVQLNSDLTAVVEGSHCRLFERDAEEKNLLEGSRMIKHDGKYYLLMISWTGDILAVKSVIVPIISGELMRRRSSWRPSSLAMVVSDKVPLSMLLMANGMALSSRTEGEWDECSPWSHALGKMDGLCLGMRMEMCLSR